MKFITVHDIKCGYQPALNKFPLNFLFTIDFLFQVFNICMKSDAGDPKPIKFAEKLGVKLTIEEKDLFGKNLLKVRPVLYIYGEDLIYCAYILTLV